MPDPLIILESTHLTGQAHRVEAEMDSTHYSVVVSRWPAHLDQYTICLTTTGRCYELPRLMDWDATYLGVKFGSLDDGEAMRAILNHIGIAFGEVS